MNDVILEIESLKKNFGSTKVLNNISLTIGKGQFVTLLGPSGCGKTTTLRIIGGFETADTGKIRLNGKDITNDLPEQRKVNTVFQNYALFPHMDVYRNVAYGLKVRKLPKEQIDRKVNEVLALVQMEEYKNRKPEQLSGGQRQRIAIARALVNEPEILLLDEPLGALDLKLRHHMQSELKRMQKNLGITFIYVTHDQEEALNMSDKLVVMDRGTILQQGSPKEIYDYPKNKFVAEFVGDRNIIEGTVAELKDHQVVIDFNGTKVLATDYLNIAKKGVKVEAAIHADRITAHKEKEAENAFSICGIVHDAHFSGAQTKLTVQLKNGLNFKKTEYNNELGFREGDEIFLSWDAKDLVVID